MMNITGLSHLVKWENLHNWWLTKYFLPHCILFFFFFQNRYPIMVKCLNIGKNIGKPIYRSISKHESPAVYDYTAAAM